MRAALLLTLAALAPAAAGEPPPLDGAATSDHPAVGALLALDSTGRGVAFCSASLIDPGWALTSAGCLDEADALDVYGYSQLYLFLGTDLTTGIDDYAAVGRVIQHPAWDPATGQADLGLLELSSSITSAEPVYVNTEDAEVALKGASDIALVGWGLSDPADQSSGGTKRAADAALCVASPCPADAIDDDHIYARDASASYACYGDLGGAAALAAGDAWVIAGVIAYAFDDDGATDDCDGAGAAAARTDAQASWIEGYVSLPEVPEAGDTGDTGDTGAPDTGDTGDADTGTDTDTGDAALDTGGDSGDTGVDDTGVDDSGAVDSADTGGADGSDSGDPDSGEPDTGADTGAADGDGGAAGCGAGGAAALLWFAALGAGRRSG